MAGDSLAMINPKEEYSTVSTSVTARNPSGATSATGVTNSTLPHKDAQLGSGNPSAGGPGSYHLQTLPTTRTAYGGDYTSGGAAVPSSEIMAAAVGCRTRRGAVIQQKSALIVAEKWKRGE